MTASFTVVALLSAPLRALNNKFRIVPSIEATAPKSTLFPLVEVRPSPHRIALSIKRAFDIVVAIAGLAGFSPIILLAIALTRLDSPGPSFIRQVRYAPHRKPFGSYRFRIASIQSSSLGHVLRTTGIDALPQLINIIQGDMSIVGPQPYVGIPHDTGEENLAQGSLRCLKPGIIGWAQLNRGRGTIAHDLYYAEHWSLLFDFKIIMMSMLSRSAYSIERIERFK